jgi:hypothetical protein
MSIGFSHNNPGNVTPLPGGRLWPGQTGVYKAKDQTSVSFSSMAYGLSAMIWQLSHDVNYKNIKNLYQLAKNYVGVGGDPVYVPYAKRILARLKVPGKTIHDNFLQGDPQSILLLAMALQPEETPEKVPTADWQQGYALFLQKIGAKDTVTEAPEGEKIPIGLLFFLGIVTIWYLVR